MRISSRACTALSTEGSQGSMYNNHYRADWPVLLSTFHDGSQKTVFVAKTLGS